jgi:outer membrane protein OmpA-like peptidoglycan-associated protein
MKKLLSTLMIVTLFITLFSGCGTEEAAAQPENYCFLLGNTNNQMQPVPEDITQIASLCTAGNSTYTLVLADGAPYVAVPETVIPDNAAKNYDKTTILRKASQYAEEVSGYLLDAAPRTDETDFAAALTLAVRQIRAAQDGNGYDGQLVICHSGISTMGLIDMVSTPISLLDVDSAVEQLLPQLPSMEGISCTWYFLGDVAGDQSALNPEETQTLQAFYEALITGLGGTVTFSSVVPSSGAWDFPEITVSAMDTAGVSNQLVDAEIPEPEESPEPVLEETPAPVLTFDDSEIAFVSNSDTLLDPTAAAAAVSAKLDYLLETGETVVLVGTTASGQDPEFCQDLALRRAKVVRNLFLAAGLPENQIAACVGAGFSSSLYQNDLDESGSQVEALAAKNRTVSAFLASGDVSEFLSGSFKTE